MAYRILFGIALLAMVSCSGQQLLLTDREGQLVELIERDTNHEHIIRTDDKLSISIWDHNDLSVGSVFTIYNSNESFGNWLLVDEDGMVTLPKLGRFKLAGLTSREASQQITDSLSTTVKDPIVLVKVLNKEVSVFGEVRSPGNYSLEKEITTITEVIGKAEGFTDFADVKEVSLIRDDIRYTINLKHMDEAMLYGMPLYADDIIIIPSKRWKELNQKAPTVIPFSSALTAIVLAASLIL